VCDGYLVMSLEVKSTVHQKYN